MARIALKPSVLLFVSLLIPARASAHTSTDALDQEFEILSELGDSPRTDSHQSSQRADSDGSWTLGTQQGAGGLAGASLDLEIPIDPGFKLQLGGEGTLAPTGNSWLAQGGFHAESKEPWDGSGDFEFQQLPGRTTAWSGDAEIGRLLFSGATRVTIQAGATLFQTPVLRSLRRTSTENSSQMRRTLQGRLGAGISRAIGSTWSLRTGYEASFYTGTVESWMERLAAEVASGAASNLLGTFPRSSVTGGIGWQAGDFLSLDLDISRTLLAVDESTLTALALQTTLAFSPQWELSVGGGVSGLDTEGASPFWQLQQAIRWNW